jgi:hypothetical protein
MWNRTKLSTALGAAAILTVSAACQQDNPTSAQLQDPGASSQDSTFATNTNRRFDQVERLGNPLTAEVFIQKREHDAYDALPAKQDPAHFTDDIVDFVRNVGGRQPAYADAIAAALVGTSAANPGDKIAVFTTRAAGINATNSATAATVGWLSNVLDPANGYGGRKIMGDDVVDKGLSVVFGTALGNTDHVTPSLVSDNVSANDRTATTTFPYFPTPNP